MMHSASDSDVSHIDASGTPRWFVPRAAASLEKFIGFTVESCAALLVVLEIIILFVGVVSRYAFHKPIVAADEISAILFLWLSMLGAVIAFRRRNHMRMMAVVNKVSKSSEAILNAIASTAAIAFCLMLLMPALHYAMDEQIILTPALEISAMWRAIALPIGVALMAVLGTCHLLREKNHVATYLAIALTLSVMLFFYLISPALPQLGNYNLLIFFVGFVALTVVAGIPIAFCFGLATFGYLSLSTTVPLEVVVGTMDEGMSHLILLSVPLFVFLGLLIEMTGMAKSMVAFLASLVGHVKGGLSYVLVGAMYLISGISGAKAADMAAVAPVLFPEMRERGAKPGDLVALLAATGAQTESIPPSLVLITIGSVTGVSIAALFTGGLLPAVLLGSMLCVVVWYRYRHEDLSHVHKASGKIVLNTLLVASPSLALPFIIRAAVVEGVATATEVSTIGIVYSIVVGLLVYRKFDWSRIPGMLVETASLSGAILLIIGAATGMAWSLTQSGFAHELASLMANLPGGRVTFLIVSMFAFIILGSVLEGIPAIVLFGPLLFPIARQMGVHEVHYSMIVILAMGIGLFAPPFGVGYYAACAISKINPVEGMKPIIGYLLALVVGLLIVVAVPWISIGFL